MLNARIELRGEELFCADTADGGALTVRRLAPETLDRLRGWAESYDKAVQAGALPPLGEIGRDIAAFLDEGDRWLHQVLGGTGEIALDIAVPGRPEERERILLDVPWELLAPNSLFLASDNERLFRVTRRIGGAGTPATSAYRDLALLFMAEEVDGQGVLSYEQEEAAILQATKGLALNLMVEESGAIEFLGQRIAQDGPFEALHLSCHGNIVKGEPFICLETLEGGEDRVNIVALSEALGEEGRKPALVFLSACRTGEHGAAAASFVQSLVRSGVQNAVGWDGSVYDADAIGFAEVLYRELAAGRSVAYAAAQGRRALLRAHLTEPSRGRHWHLARVYAGPQGGGPLCDTRRPPRLFRRDAGYKEFLDKQGRVQVASTAEFVGRRRQAQRILRTFRHPQGAGVLIHGMGSQGKSSLAARIANRMPGHDIVVIYQRYDALTVFEALRNELPPRLRAEFDQTWRQQVTNDASTLHGALVDMLEGPFRTADPDKGTKPVLLIVDDLEKILETPRPGEASTPVKTAYIVTLASIIAAFRDAETESRLLLTSRYTFALTDARGDDLAARLVAAQLPPMDETQRDKQMRAAARLAGAEPGAGAGAAGMRAALEARIKEAAGGNPGLQAILSRPLLVGEIEAAERAVATVERYLESGEVPTEAGAAAEFLENLSLTAFREMLTPQETQQLRAATMFSVPVPLPALVGAGEAASVKEPVRAIERLRGLGLMDLYLVAGANGELAVNSLARPLVPPLTDAESAQIAEKAIAPLYTGWKDADGNLPEDQRGLEAARLALLGQAPPDIVNASSLAAVVFLFHTLHEADPALDLVLAALSALDRAEAVPDPHLIRNGADCAERLGKSDIQEMLLERGLAINGGDPRARAMLFFARASRLIQTGHIGAAEELLKEAAGMFESLGDERSRAVTMGQIADILQARGQLDDALKIRNEEQLPVYERLGDVRSRAVTMGKIADILQARSQLDEALKILREEVLPAMERLGDVRSRALTMGQIADILQARGQLDEALKIRNEEQLPVYERLGDVRSLLVGRANLAITLLQRAEEGDREEARNLLNLALDDARRLNLPEAQQIEQLIERAGIVASSAEQEVVWNDGARGGASGGGVSKVFPVPTWQGGLQTTQTSDGISPLPLRGVPDVSGDVDPETGYDVRIDWANTVPTVDAEVPEKPPAVRPSPTPEPATRGDSGEPGMAPQPGMGADKAEYVVWYGTNRRPIDANDAGKGFSALRDNVVHYGSCPVFIPESHKIGSIGSPWWKRLITLTDDRLRLLAIDALQQSVYWNCIAAQLAAIDADERGALIFVHGYNVSFEEAALRAAQIGFDLSVKGAMAFFSWPSQGATRAYSADEATIEASEGVIADFMTDFAERSGATAVHIIAHSMGNRGVLRAVNRIAAKAQRRTGKPFGQVILAAADVDADVFRQLSAAYADVASRTTLYVSKRDRAVEASRWLHHFARAGLMPPTLVVPGIDTINATNVDLTMLGHGYIAEARDVLIDMHALITRGAPPDERFGLHEAKNEEGARYWLIGA